MQADNSASKITAVAARSDEQQGSAPSTALVRAAGPARTICSHSPFLPPHVAATDCILYILHRCRPRAALAPLADAPVDRAPRVSPMRQREAQDLLPLSSGRVCQGALPHSASPSRDAALLFSWRER
jgi:hypothetical protein